MNYQTLNLEKPIAETPDNIADLMVELSEIPVYSRILEPSAGKGAIIRSINKYFQKYEIKPNISVCEMNEDNKYYLGKDFDVHFISHDFLKINNDLKFDRIIMNPPFKNGSDIKHIQKVYNHLNKNGILTVLLHRFWIDSEESVYSDFRNWILKRGRFLYKKVEIGNTKAGIFKIYK